MLRSQGLSQSTTYLSFNFEQLDNTDLELDTETLKRVEAISNFSDDDKKHIYILLDALIRDFKTKKAYS